MSGLGGAASVQSTEQAIWANFRWRYQSYYPWMPARAAIVFILLLAPSATC